MGKYIKYGIVILIIVIVATGIFLGIYFVSQVSAVYPPIKEYNFTLSVNDFEKKIIEIAEKEPNLNYFKQDTVGNLENGFAYYMEIVIKDKNTEIDYLVKYSDSKYNQQHLELKLIHAFDKLNNIGGYHIEDAGVKKLLETFYKEIVLKIERK